MSQQSSAMRAFVTRYNPEPIKEDVSTQTEESKESVGESSEQTED